MLSVMNGEKNNSQKSIEFNGKLRKNRFSWYVTIPPADAFILKDKLQVRIGDIINVKITVKKYD